MSSCICHAIKPACLQCQTYLEMQDVYNALRKHAKDHGSQSSFENVVIAELNRQIDILLSNECLKME